jgi:hypothetical protein
VSTYFEDMIKLKSEHLADLKKSTAEVEREISDARDSLQRESMRRQFAAAPAGPAAEPDFAAEACQCEQCQPQRSRVPSPRRPAYSAPRLDYGFAAAEAELAGTGRFEADQYADGRFKAGGYADGGYADGQYADGLAGGDPDGAETGPDEERTTILINKGRSSAHQPKLALSRKLVIGVIAAATLLAVLVLLVTAGGGASWPSSVARVQGWMEQACRNPNVMSEPGQVNFACAKGSRQILWVFSLITSGNNPSFADTKTGRQGLEPITPGQGGAVAAALNLHHPYDPSNPVDSLQVAARAINDIIGGATVTSTSGTAEVQPGLESSAANCLRYTGSAAMNARQGYPVVCARPLTARGQAALVRDVYRKWVVGAPAVAARDAAVLFQNAKNPGDPQVQYILNHPPAAALSP